jgi:trigger factor
MKVLPHREGEIKLQTERKELDRQVELRVTVPSDKVDGVFSKATIRLGRDASIPGFRKGKAPPNVVKAFLGKERIKEEALSSLLEEVMDEVYESEGITPLFSPQVQVEQFEEGMPFVFRMVVDPWPQFELPPVEKVQLDLPPPRVTDADVDKAIFRLRESYAALDLKDEPAETGDVIMMKWRMGDEPWHTEVLELGKEGFLPNFDDNLKGLKAGDQKVVSVDLKEEKASLEVQVIEVKRKELPPENDEFARNFQAPNLDDLRQKVRQDLESYVKNEYQKQLREEFLRKYLELIPIDFSEHAQNKALTNYVESFQDYLRKNGRKLEDFLRQLGLTEEEWRETVARKQAVQTLKEQIVLWQVADERNIQIEEGELREALRGQENRDPETLYASMRRKKALEELFHDWQVSFYLDKKETEEGR